MIDVIWIGCLFWVGCDELSARRRSKGEKQTQGLNQVGGTGAEVSGDGRREAEYEIRDGTSLAPVGRVGRH